MLSTRGKFQQPLNSLHKTQANLNLGHEALIQDKAENKVCEDKTEIQPVDRKNNLSYKVNERPRVCQRASAFLDSLGSAIICSFLHCK